MAAGSVSQAYTSGTFWQGFGAFFDPIVEQFGWSRATTSLAISLQRTESGMISPFVGYFIDKFGPKIVMIFGIILTGLGFILLSRINSLWQFYAAFLLITLGLSFGTFLVITTAVANWFEKKRSRAMSITMAGSGLGGVLVPGIVWLIATTDWRFGLFAIGVGFWVVGIPVAFIMRRRPEDYGMLPDGVSEAAPNDEDGADDDQPSVQAVSTDVAFTAKQAVFTRTFWQLTMAMGASQLIISASIHHFPAITSFGMSREVAGVIILGVSIFSVAGRLSSGFVGDFVDKRWVLAGAFFFQFVGTLVFAFSSSTWHMVVFVIFWGFGFGASIPVRFALIADYFGRRHYGSVMGLMMTASTLFGVVGPVLVGYIFDVRGNYRDPFVLMAFSVLVSIPIILSIRPPGGRRGGPASA